MSVLLLLYAARPDTLDTLLVRPELALVLAHSDKPEVARDLLRPPRGVIAKLLGAKKGEDPIAALPLDRAAGEGSGINLDTEWEAVHLILSEGDYNAEGPGSFIINGGRRKVAEDGVDFKIFDPDETAEIAAALSARDAAEWVEQSYDLAVFRDAMPGYEPYEGEAADRAALTQHVAALTQFVTWLRAQGLGFIAVFA